MKKPYTKPEIKYLELPVLYPMGALTFAIACSHCNNIGSDKCYDCKNEKKSGFELRRDTNAERNH